MTEKMFYSKSDDPKMDRACHNARLTFKMMWRELSWEMRRIVSGVDASAVKRGFPTSRRRQAPSVEYVWIGDISFDGSKITGRLLNQPNYIDGLHQDDRAEFARDEICDWLYVLEGRVYGAFTVSLLRQRMTLPDRKKHDAAWGYDFGDPSTVLLAPGLSFAAYQNTQPRMIPEHPMSLNMADKSEQGIMSLGSRINDPMVGCLNLLQFEALAGNLTQVNLALKHGADKGVKNVNGHTALDLAASMEWAKIVEVLR